LVLGAPLKLPFIIITILLAAEIDRYPQPGVVPLDVSAKVIVESNLEITCLRFNFY
jgi:hypothetical protein